MIFKSAKELFSYLDEMEMEANTFDGFDAALIGTADQGLTTVAVYDYEKVIEILMSRDKMSYHGAEDWYCYNMLNEFDGAPVVLDFKVSTHSSPSQDLQHEAGQESPDG